MRMKRLSDSMVSKLKDEVRSNEFDSLKKLTSAQRRHKLDQLQAHCGWLNGKPKQKLQNFIDAQRSKSHLMISLFSVFKGSSSKNAKKRI